MMEGLYEKYGVEISAARAAFDKQPSERRPSDREQINRYHRAIKQAKKLILLSARPSKFHEKPGVRKKVRSTRPVAAVRPDDLSYQSFLPPLALDYLASRKITDSSTAKWELGWSLEDARLVIPARAINGRLRFLIKRGLRENQQPKYLYTQGFPKTSLLFGACYLDLGLLSSSGLILVEGSLDTIRFHQHGLTNTVGILGTGISDAQCRIIEKLRPKKITLAFDKDVSGIRNIEIAQRKLPKYPLYVMRYPHGRSDPAELTRREALNQISKALPLVLFQRQTRTTTRKELHGTHS
jgi:5S rRNA maturation endonuclease (ribonuclease M5)